MIRQNKIFGASCDPPNSPERLNIKLAYLEYVMRASHAFSEHADPYDMLYASFPVEDQSGIGVWLGKVPTESWLTPRPDISDFTRLTADNTDNFLVSNGCWDYALWVADFVEEYVLPERPVMIGVDHSVTGGPLLALSRRYKDLNVVVLDAHFDVMKSSGMATGFETGRSEKNCSFYHCGNFLCRLLEEGVIFPENLWILGVDPGGVCIKDTGVSDELPAPEKKEFRRWIDSGVHLLTKAQVASGGFDLMLNGPTYVSIDMDMGSMRSVFSARYMNCYGLSREQFLGVLSGVKRSIEKARVPLVGLDIMEVDIHLLEALEMMPYGDCTKYLAKTALKMFLN